MSMEKSSFIKQLDYHQQKIGGVLRWAAPILAKEAVSTEAVDELLSRRMELSRLLMEYALFKHRDVFEPIIAAGGSKGAEAMRLKLACIDAGEAYRDYIRTATQARPGAHWSIYRAAAAGMAQSMNDHLVQERAGIRTLLGFRMAKQIRAGDEANLQMQVPVI